MTNSTALAFSTVFGGSPSYDREGIAAETITIQGFEYSRTFRVGDYGKYYRNISFREEGWARSHLGGLNENVTSAKVIAEKFASQVPGAAADIRAAFDKWVERHVRHWLDYIVGHGQQASAMIVGPAKFPTRSQEKKRRWSDNRYERITAHRAAITKRLKRIAYPHGAPGEAIRSNNPDAPELLRAKIEKLEARQEFMKRANREVKKALKVPEGEQSTFLCEQLGIDEATARKMLEPSYMGRVFAFGGYELSNNLANIKRLKQRLDNIEANKERGSKEVEVPVEGVRYVENVEAMRAQLIFDGKPDPETRKILKSNGFRWAPSQGAWQRHLNNNGRRAAERVVQALKAS
ncbi:MAG: hypothetical protein ACX94B_13045 [Henriciella sp.]